MANTDCLYVDSLDHGQSAVAIWWRHHSRDRRFTTVAVCVRGWISHTGNAVVDDFGNLVPIGFWP